ncbi:hypothetical protein [Roseibium sp.]|uniref:hypothetical protein n=1 Tax=Roseibium sp. TaxID=1936156 RepID=UPI003A97C23A
MEYAFQIRLPHLYVKATHDRSVVLQAQRRMRDLVPGAIVRTLKTGADCRSCSTVTDGN